MLDWHPPLEARGRRPNVLNYEVLNMAKQLAVAKGSRRERGRARSPESVRRGCRGRRSERGVRRSLFTLRLLFDLPT